jgi:hypothetical protein
MSLSCVKVVGRVFVIRNPINEFEGSKEVQAQDGDISTEERVGLQ